MILSRMYEGRDAWIDITGTFCGYSGGLRNLTTGSTGAFVPRLDGFILILQTSFEGREYCSPKTDWRLVNSSSHIAADDSFDSSESQDSSGWPRSESCPLDRRICCRASAAFPSSPLASNICLQRSRE